MKRLILHVGVPNTGSSLIQLAMRQLRTELRHSGVAYIDRKTMNRLKHFSGWSAYHKAIPENRNNFVKEMRSTVKREVRHTFGRRAVVVSNETLIGSSAPNFGDPYWPLATAALTDVIDAIRPESTTVLMYVRRQDRLIESQYMQRIHLGKTRRWEKFYSRVCLDDRVRYQDVIDSIKAVPTVDEIKVSPFEIIGAGPEAFARYFLRSLDLNLEHLSSELGELRRSNPSYTQPAYEIALRINKHLETRAQKEATRTYLKALFPVGEYPKAQLLAKEERLELIERYRPLNEKFFATHMPDFPVDSYSSVEATQRLASWLV